MPTSSSQSWEVQLSLWEASRQTVRDSACLGFGETSANFTYQILPPQSSACCIGQEMQGLLHSCTIANSVHTWMPHQFKHECPVNSRLSVMWGISCRVLIAETWLQTKAAPVTVVQQTCRDGNIGPEGVKTWWSFFQRKITEMWDTYSHCA